MNSLRESSAGEGDTNGATTDVFVAVGFIGTGLSATELISQRNGSAGNLHGVGR